MPETTTMTTPKAGYQIQPITYPVMESAIKEMADKYMALTVESVDDAEGLKQVHESRIEVKKLRVAVEKRRKELKADSLEYGRRVDAAAKHLAGLLEPVEKHLEHEEGIVARENERLRQEAEAKRQQRIRERLESLRDVGHVALAEDIAELSHTDFQKLLEAKTAEKAEREERERQESAERERQAEEQRKEAERLAEERAEFERQRKEQEAAAAEAKRKEDERLAAEREELNRQRREQAEAQAKIEAEQRRIAEEEAERKRQEELNRAQAEAAERAKREAEEQAKREAEEAKQREAAAEAERQRIAALRPDHDKLMDVAEAVLQLRLPEVSAGAHKSAAKVAAVLKRAAADVKRIAEELVSGDEA